ncbi:MAG TPA: 2-dehydropantoate 2-reductase [Anaerolineae bacterium]|nr:2-dehydropantoate 2-reductase [Anaerolineae bacterium]
MKILVYGAGSVGLYIGGRLSLAGQEVSLVMRPGPATRINDNGLSIEDGRESFSVQPEAFGSLRQAVMGDQDYDVVIMAMKSYDLERSVNELAAFYRSPKHIITLQNGIGIEESVAKQFGAERVTSGSVTIPITIDASNTVQVERQGRGVSLAAVANGGDVGHWVQLFNDANIATTAVSSYRSMKWSKALLNMMGNASSAILNRHPNVVYKSDVAYTMEHRMLMEILAVMDALGIEAVNLPGAPAKWLSYALRLFPAGILKPILANQVSSGRGDKMPSFHIDLTNKKGKSEVFFHNGAVALAGRAAGVKTPVNAALADVLMQLTEEQIPWDSYSGRPRELAEQVRQYM